jgi:hypothetical protein
MLFEARQGAVLGCLLQQIVSAARAATFPYKILARKCLNR